MSSITSIAYPTGYSVLQVKSMNDSGDLTGTTETLSAPFTYIGFVAHNNIVALLTPPTGYPLASPSAINNNGLVLGIAYTNSYQTLEAVTWQNGAPTVLLPLTPGDFTSVGGTNNAGVIAGAEGSYTGATVAHAIIWQNGVPTSLPPLTQGTSAGAAAINDIGAIVGGTAIGTTDATGVQNTHAIFWQNSSATPIDLGTLPGYSTRSNAVAINNADQIIGTSVNTAADGSQVKHSFIWQNGVMTDLGVLPGETSTIATGINNAGQVVGYCYGIGSQSERGFIWQNGVMTDLSSLITLPSSSQAINQGAAINNNGQIAVSINGGAQTDIVVLSTLSGTYNSLTPGNFIDLPYAPFNPLTTTLTYTNGTLSAMEGSANLGSCTVGGTGITGLSSANFYLQPDGTGGTEIGVAPSPFTITDTTTNATSTSSGAANSGSLSYLQRQYVYSGADNVNIAANIPNVFIQAGNGILNGLSVSSGHNVLNGGLGSNFLIGVAATANAPTGQDSFFVDGRGNGNVWSTAVNFHQGDSITMWGVTSATALHQQASNGAAGSTGFTIFADVHNDGSYSAGITLAGVTQAHVNESFGSIGGSSYLYLTWM